MQNNGFKQTPSNLYTLQCYDKDGNLKWEESVNNAVTNEGLNDSLSKYFKGSAYTAAFYVGLTDGTPTLAATDTLASHAGWAEVSLYTGNRPTLTLGAVASQSVDNSASKASYTFTGGGTVGGIFLSTAATGTAGILYATSALSADRPVVSTDVLNITVTLTTSN